jgi:hypothetical protein
MGVRMTGSALQNRSVIVSERVRSLELKRGKSKAIPVTGREGP